MSFMNNDVLYDYVTRPRVKGLVPDLALKFNTISSELSE